MRTTEGYREGAYLAQCDTCGRMTWDFNLVAQVLQAPGGGDSGLRVCAHHVNPYHPQNDAASYEGDDPIVGAFPRPEKRRTTWTGNLDADADDSNTQSTPTTTAVTPSTESVANLLASPTLTVDGTNFSESWPVTKVRWAGTIIEATTYVNATQVTCTIPAGLIAAGAIAIDVENIGPPYRSSAASGLSQDDDSLNTVNQSNDQTLTVT